MRRRYPWSTVRRRSAAAAAAIDQPPTQRPSISLAEREDWLERAIQEEWINVFEHDPNVAMGKIGWKDRKFVLDPLEEVARPGN